MTNNDIVLTIEIVEQTWLQEPLPRTEGERHIIWPPMPEVYHYDEIDD